MAIPLVIPRPFGLAFFVIAGEVYRELFSAEQPAVLKFLESVALGHPQVVNLGLKSLSEYTIHAYKNGHVLDTKFRQDLTQLSQSEVRLKAKGIRSDATAIFIALSAPAQRHLEGRKAPRRSCKDSSAP